MKSVLMYWANQCKLVDEAYVDNEHTPCPIYELFLQNAYMLEVLARRESLSTRLDTKKTGRRTKPKGREQILPCPTGLAHL